MMFGDVLERKEGVLPAINKYVLCSRKMGYFPNGLTHDFGQKLELSSLFFFLLNIGQEIMIGDVLDRKEAFLNN